MKTRADTSTRMEVILDRIASWAPHRQVFNLFYSLHEEDDTRYHIGTFSTFEMAVECGRQRYAHYPSICVTASFLDDPGVFEVVWKSTI